MNYFDGHFLFALPSLDGSYFERNVIYINAHNELGALGVVINNPLPNLDVKEFVAANDLSVVEGTTDCLTLYSGGPVDVTSGFILYEERINNADSVIKYSTEKALLKDILSGNNWQKNQIIIGRSSWSPGQLEAEFERGAWWVSPAFSELVFDVPHQQRWRVGIEQLGISPDQLSTFSGRA